MPGRVLEHCHNKSKQRVLVRKKTRARRSNWSKVDQRCRIRRLGVCAYYWINNYHDKIETTAKLHAVKQVKRVGWICYEFCPVALTVRAIKRHIWHPGPAHARTIRNMDITCREKRSKNTIMRWYLRPSKCWCRETSQFTRSTLRCLPCTLDATTISHISLSVSQPIISQIGMLKVARECLSTQPTVRPSMSEIKGIGRCYWHVP